MKHSSFNPSMLDVSADCHVPCYLWTNLICLEQPAEGKYCTVLVTNNHVIKTFEDAMGRRIIFENVFPDRNITLN